MQGEGAETPDPVMAAFSCDGSAPQTYAFQRSH
jgi:hypothetical protein